jgi:hypothetical protein
MTYLWNVEGNGKNYDHYKHGEIVLSMEEKWDVYEMKKNNKFWLLIHRICKSDVMCRAIKFARIIHIYTEYTG